MTIKNVKKGQKKGATEAEFITKVLPVGFQTKCVAERIGNQWLSLQVTLSRTRVFINSGFDRLTDTVIYELSVCFKSKYKAVCYCQAQQDGREQKWYRAPSRCWRGSPSAEQGPSSLPGLHELLLTASVCTCLLRKRDVRSSGQSNQYLLVALNSLKRGKGLNVSINQGSSEHSSKRFFFQS